MGAELVGEPAGQRATAVDQIGDALPAASLSADLAFEDGKLVESGAGGASVWGTGTESDPPARLAFTWSPTGGLVTSIGIDLEETDGQARGV